ncbi:MAG: hypothetical protein AAGC93_06540 [Cyanobacteria bacterium P01_F01_bin.53]
MNSNTFIDPRHEIWMETANLLRRRYLSSEGNVDWNELKKNIPSIEPEIIERLVNRIESSRELHKADRITLIILKLLSDSPISTGLEIIRQLNRHITEVETVFVPWHIVIENQKRNHHEAETDPIKLAQLYRIDSTQRAIQDAMAGVPPQKRDPFYRGIMKPPSETASRRNIFPGKAIYGLTAHLIIVDESNGAIQIQPVGDPYKSTITGLWFDKDYFKSMPNRPYIFQKPDAVGENVWDNYAFNQEADLGNKKS